MDQFGSKYSKFNCNFPPRLMGTRGGESSDCKKGQKREGEEGEEKPNIQYWPLRRGVEGTKVGRKEKISQRQKMY